MAPARVRSRMGGELDLGLPPRLLLAGARRRAPAGDGELRPPPEPVLRPAALRGPRRPRLAAPGPAGGRDLRSGRQRPRVARALSGRASLALRRLRPDEVSSAVRAPDDLLRRIGVEESELGLFAWGIACLALTGAAAFALMNA